MSALFLPLGLLGLAQVTRWGSPRLTAVGLPLALWGMWGFHNVLAMGYVAGTVTPAVLGVEEAVALNDDGLVGHPGVVGTALVPHLLGSFLGMFVLMLAAWRSGLSRAACALVMVFLVWDFLLPTDGVLQPHVLLAVGSAGSASGCPPPSAMARPGRVAWPDRHHTERMAGPRRATRPPCSRGWPGSARSRHRARPALAAGPTTRSRGSRCCCPWSGSSPGCCSPPRARGSPTAGCCSPSRALRRRRAGRALLAQASPGAGAAWGVWFVDRPRRTSCRRAPRCYCSPTGGCRPRAGGRGDRGRAPGGRGGCVLPGRGSGGQARLVGRRAVAGRCQPGRRAAGDLVGDAGGPRPAGAAAPAAARAGRVRAPAAAGRPGAAAAAGVAARRRRVRGRGRARPPRLARGRRPARRRRQRAAHRGPGRDRAGPRRRRGGGPPGRGVGGPHAADRRRVRGRDRGRRSGGGGSRRWGPGRWPPCWRSCCCRCAAGCSGCSGGCCTATATTRSPRSPVAESTHHLHGRGGVEEVAAAVAPSLRVPWVRVRRPATRPARPPDRRTSGSVPVRSRRSARCWRLDPTGAGALRTPAAGVVARQAGIALRAAGLAESVGQPGATGGDAGGGAPAGRPRPARRAGPDDRLARHGAGRPPRDRRLRPGRRDRPARPAGAAGTRRARRRTTAGARAATAFPGPARAGGGAVPGRRVARPRARRPVPATLSLAPGSKWRRTGSGSRRWPTWRPTRAPCVSFELTGTEAGCGW